MTAAITHLRGAAPRPLATPPMNVGAYLHGILTAATGLLRNNHRIKSVYFQEEPSRIVIELHDCPRLRQMTVLGLANYYRQGVDADGPFRLGGFERDGVNVMWREEGV